MKVCGKQRNIGMCTEKIEFASENLTLEEMESRDTFVKMFSINSDRLTSKYDHMEWKGIDFLLRGELHVNLDTIKNHILCMDTTHPNYSHLPDYRKKLVKRLKENEDVVDIVLLTVFQWFGTSVGQYEIGVLLDEIRGKKK